MFIVLIVAAYFVVHCSSLDTSNVNKYTMTVVSNSSQSNNNNNHNNNNDNDNKEK